MEIEWFLKCEREDKRIQKKIGYTFQNLSLLAQAFTRRSYAEESKTPFHNEVLEFYGDKVLDFFVMKKLSQQFGAVENKGFSSTMSEGELTEIKKKLVCRETLALRIRELQLNHSLICSFGDAQQRVHLRESVQEDLFEAILGAVAIDCNWNIDILEAVVGKMLNLDCELQKCSGNEIDYVQVIQQWHQKRYGVPPSAKFFDCIMSLDLMATSPPDATIECRITFANARSFGGLGANKVKARKEACRQAYLYLKESNLLLSVTDEIGKADFDKAVNQLQELYQKKHISEPQYKFTESHNENGDPVWECECFVESLNQGFSVSMPSKMQAKKAAAFEIVWLFTGEVDTDDAK